MVPAQSADKAFRSASYMAVNFDGADAAWTSLEQTRENAYRPDVQKAPTRVRAGERKVGRGPFQRCRGVSNFPSRIRWRIRISFSVISDSVMSEKCSAASIKISIVA